MPNAIDHSPAPPKDRPAPPADAPVIADDGRRRALSVLVESEGAELARLVGELGPLSGQRDLRPPETGLVMIRGRICGDGAPFNIGEATVTRAVVQLKSGEIGFGYVLGRDGARARLVALCDALFQCESFRPRLEAGVLEPLRRRNAARRRTLAEQTAATRVEFFTVVRGENE